MKFGCFVSIFALTLTYGASQIRNRGRLSPPEPPHTLNDGHYHPISDGRYVPDNSGKYRPDGSGAYKHKDNPYKGQNIGAIPYSGTFDRGTYTPDSQPLIPYIPFKDRYPYIPFKDQYPYQQKPDQYPYNQKPDQGPTKQADKFPNKPFKDQYPYEQKPDQGPSKQADKFPKKPYEQKPEKRPTGGEGLKGLGFPGLKSLRGVRFQGCA